METLNSMGMTQPRSFPSFFITMFARGGPDDRPTRSHAIATTLHCVSGTQLGLNCPLYAHTIFDI